MHKLREGNVSQHVGKKEKKHNKFESPDNKIKCTLEWDVYNTGNAQRNQ